MEKRMPKLETGKTPARSLREIQRSKARQVRKGGRLAQQLITRLAARRVRSPEDVAVGVRQGSIKLDDPRLIGLGALAGRLGEVGGELERLVILEEKAVRAARIEQQVGPLLGFMASSGGVGVRLRSDQVLRVAGLDADVIARAGALGYLHAAEGMIELTPKGEHAYRTRY
jgi:hypothetical protein